MKFAVLDSVPMDVGQPNVVIAAIVDSHYDISIGESNELCLAGCYLCRCSENRDAYENDGQRE